jgi:protein TonB
MNDNINKGQLFNQAGCLLFDTLQRYQRDDLNPSEKKLVENHLKYCELCRDALDGYALYPDKVKQQEHLSSLKEQLWIKIRHRKGRLAKPSLRRFNRKFVYISVAASILIIVSFFGIFYSEFIHRPELIADNVNEEKPNEMEKESTYLEEEIEEVVSLDNVLGEPEEKMDLKAEDVEDLEIESEEQTLSSKSVVDKITEARLVRTDTIDILHEIAGVAYTESISENEDTILIAQNQPEAIEKTDTESKGIIAKPKVEMISAEYSPKSRKKSKSLFPEHVSPESEIFFIVEEMPEFIKRDYSDFNEYIQKNLQYPEEAIEKEIGGTVVVQFVIDIGGKVKNVEVVKKANPLLDKEAIRVVSSSPTWKPGKQNGIKVNVLKTQPVEFKLE